MGEPEAGRKYLLWELHFVRVYPIEEGRGQCGDTLQITKANVQLNLSHYLATNLKTQ
jgi:hypothetical protein